MGTALSLFCCQLSDLAGPLNGTDLVSGKDGVAVYDEGLGLRTADAASPGVDGTKVLGSLIGFGLIYLCLGAAWLFVLDRKIKHGPEPAPAVDGGEG